MAVIEAIATTYLEADAASVTFSSIPATYEHLRLSGNARYAASGALNNWLIEFNGSGGTAYSTHTMQGYGSSTTAKRYTGSATIIISSQIHGEDMVIAEYCPLVLEILDYANTNKNTTCTTFGNGQNRLGFGSGLWDSTAAVNAIELSSAGGSLLRGSEFTLYGLKSS